ncbi:cell wall-binding repeat-containing protein, partial [Clostridium sp.]|uniref:cell wall-binding repeat-containing protein n=1 Tax=Clostridium sp. TaxID=1506 RepID=UPI003EEDD17B
MFNNTRNSLSISLSVAMLATMVTIPQVASAATSTQLSGLDRYKTSLEIVQAGWEKDSSDNVIIASGENKNMADSLAAAPLAYKMGEAPILLTKTDAIPDGVLEELARLGVKKVTIVGGTSAVSGVVESELKATGVTVERVSGADRFETSLEIAKAAFGTTSTEVVVANGLASADALSVSAIAANKGMPILLVNNRTGLTAEQKAYIAGNTVYAVGGTTVLSEAIVGNATRLSGANRYETNAAILAKFAPDYSKIFLAKGTNANLVDALVGSAYA